MEMKTVLNRVAPIVALILIALSILAACGNAPEPRLAQAYTFSPGGQFSTNFNYEDPRRRVECVVMFEVIDELAIEELTNQIYKTRNSILSVLGELTMEELTTAKDLDGIAARIVQRVNTDLSGGGDEGVLNLVRKAYFTDFVIS